MQLDELRQALKELNGERNARFCFTNVPESLLVANAFLVPEEKDRMIKLTDGQKVYFVDPDKVAWVEIG